MTSTNRPRLIVNTAALALLAAGLAVGCSSAQNATPPDAAAVNSASAIIPDPGVKELVVNSCYGCHSDQGSAPWYGTLAPSYWWSGSARKALNFSDWQSYDAQKRAGEFQAIAKTVSEGEMPPADYTFFNRSARFTEDQKQALAQWASKQAVLPAH